MAALNSSQRYVVINKTVNLDARGVGDCPFCRKHLLRTDGEFYWCFACGAGGTTSQKAASEKDKGGW